MLTGRQAAVPPGVLLRETERVAEFPGHPGLLEASSDSKLVVALLYPLGGCAGG